jgi:hypothetical protein
MLVLTVAACRGCLTLPLTVPVGYAARSRPCPDPLLTPCCVSCRRSSTPLLLEQVQPHLEGPMGMVLYEYTNGKIGPASMEVGGRGCFPMCLHG